MKKRLLLIRVLYGLFFFLMVVCAMYLYTRETAGAIIQIRSLMYKNKIEVDEAVHIFLERNKTKMTDIQKRNLFLDIMHNFTLTEGVFSSIIKMTEDELSPEIRSCIMRNVKAQMQQQQRLYYCLKLGYGSEYFTVIKDLEHIDKNSL